MNLSDKITSRPDAAADSGPGDEIDRLIRLMAKLPGLGPRSAQRIVLNLVKERETLMAPLAEALTAAAETVVRCSGCGNLDTGDPCGLCRDARRDDGLICVVEEVDDLWALERGAAFNGRYHVLGGVLSAIDGVGPDELTVARLVERAADPAVTEIILALSATVDGQATAHYVAERLNETGVTVSALAHGLPMGGELDYLDDGTLAAALKSRHTV